MKRPYYLPQQQLPSMGWLIVVALISISGCTLQPVEMSKDSNQYIHKKAVQQNLPEVELTGELLFDILVAEFAEDSGELSISSTKYLRSASTSRDPRLAKRATQVALFAKDYAGALTGAKLWVELEPENSDARQSNASLLLVQGQLEQARPHLIWLLEQDNYRGKRLVTLTKLVARAPKQVAVILFFEGLIPATTDSAQHRENILYATALLAQNRGKSEIALNRLEQLLQLNPNHADGVLLRAKLWFVGERANDAIGSLATFLEHNPQQFSVRLSYARMLVEARLLDEGLAQFKELVRQAPRNGDVIYGYGLLAIQNNKLDVAEEQFQNLIHLKLREAQARQSMGQLFELRHQPDEAIKWYRTVPKGSIFFASQLRAAQLIANRDGIEAAQQFLHQIPVAERAEELQIMVTEAELLQLNGKHEGAFELFSIALKEAPDNADLLYAHAMSAEKVDRIDILETNLKKVLKADPNNIQSLNALGYTLIDRTNRIAEAFEFIKRAYALDSKDPAILDSMGWAYYRMGDHEKALQFLKMAIEDHKDGEIYAHLGEVLWVSGDTTAARAVWDTALKFNPDHPVLKSTLERFVP